MSAKYGFRKVAEKLFHYVGMEEVEDLKDCNNDSAVVVAIIYDHKDFVENYDVSLGTIGRSLNAPKVVNLAVRYCSTNVAKFFLNYSADENEDVWNNLLLCVRWSPYGKLKVITSNCLKAFEGSSLSEAEEIRQESERRIKILRILVEAHQNKLSVLYKEDDEMTLLHYAALYGFTDAVKYLVELGADILLTNKNGYNPLMISLNVSPYNTPRASYRCFTTSDGLFTSCTTTSYDETVSYLIQLQRANIAKCDHKTALILETVATRGMALSLYALLDKGVNWNCAINSDRSPMSHHLWGQGWEVTEVVKMFEVDVSLKCGVSFFKSDLHQLAYFSSPNHFGNFFKHSFNGKRLPLKRLIDRHPRGFRILNECYDDIGNLPLHYAIRGGNLDAIKWLKSNGANARSFQDTRWYLCSVFCYILFRRQ